MRLRASTESEARQQNRETGAPAAAVEPDPAQPHAIQTALIHRAESSGIFDLKLYREIFANSNDAIAVIDPSGRYLEQNAAHRQLIGYTDEELVNESPSIHLGHEAFQQIAEA